MKDAAYSVGVNGYNRTDRGPVTLPSAGLAERRPTAYARWLTNRAAPRKQGGVRGVYDGATSRWTVFNQSGVTFWTVWTYLFVFVRFHF